MKHLSCLILGSLIMLPSQPIAAQKTEPVEAQTQAFDAASAWKEFEDNFRLFYAYLDRDDMDVEQQLARSKQVALKTVSKEAFRKILHQSALTFSDQHLIVGPFDATDYSITPTGSDLEVRFDGSKYRIADVRAGSAADRAGVRSGWQILSADGLPIDQAALKPYGAVLQRATNEQLQYGAKLAVSGLRNKARVIVFRTDKGKRTVNLAATYAYSEELRKQPILSVKRKDGIAVIRINNALGDNNLIEKFDAAIRQVADSDALILDLRNTPSGGNTEVARSIIGHFITETRSYQVHEIPSLEREFSVPRRFIEQAKPRKPQYTKPLVVLGGYWTGSMGEGLVIGLDAAADAHTFASDMGDLLGGLSNFNLEKSGARLDMGTEALFHVNGTPREDYVADIPLDAADRDDDGNDPAMKRALSHLTNIVRRNDN